MATAKKSSAKTTKKKAASEEKKGAPTKSTTTGQGPEWIQRVSRKIDASLKLSGTKPKLRPCLDEKTLAAFEKKMGASLPAEYRDYVKFHANGGNGPFGGITPLKKFENRNGQLIIEISQLDHGEPVMLMVNGANAGDVVTTDENTGELYVVDAFGPFLEKWVDDELLRYELNRAIARGALSKKKLKPELHALILEYASLLDAPGTNALPKAMLALYLGDRATAERVANEMSIEDARKGDDAKFELGGGNFGLLEALYPDELAASRSNDPAQLAKLAVHANTDVRVWCAVAEATPAEALSKMAEDSSDDVRYRVAVHANATGETLKRVFDFTLPIWKAKGGSSKLLFALEGAVRHANASVENAETICKIHAVSIGPLVPWLLRAALAQPTLPLATVESFASHEHPAVRHAVACHPALAAAADLLATLSKDEDAAVRGAVAFRFDAPTEILGALTRDSIANVLEIALWNAQTPTEAITRLIVERRSDLLPQLATIVDRLPEPAKSLVTSHPWFRPTRVSWPPPGFIDTEGRQCIASRSFRYNPGEGQRRFRPDASAYDVWVSGAYAHPSYPVPLLPAYVEEHYYNGGCELALHPWLDEKLLEILASKRDPDELTANVRSAVAMHPRLPLALLEELAKEPWKSMPAAVAKNPNVPIALLETLASSNESDVREAVAENLRTPFATLTALAKDPELRVRRAVAGNASSPLALVDALTDDPSEYVRGVVDWTKKARAYA
ncbi:MAG: hypothetical protein ABI183_11930 [Polyangiaceae bacterium]